jgi:chromosome partitioning protein
MSREINHKEAARLLGINERTLSRLVAESEIQRVKRGREILYSEADIQGLLSSSSRAVEDVRVYMIGTPKGGTAKTTSVKYAAHILADAGRRVLVVDADPQHYFSTFASASWDNAARAKLREQNLLTLLRDEKKLRRAALPYSDRIDFVAGVRQLERYDNIFGDSVGRELRLKRVLAPALSRYDVVLIDTSPAQSGITIAALFAAHALIIPIIPDIDSIDAAHDLIRSINAIRAGDLTDKFKLQRIYVLPVKQKTGLTAGFQKQVLKDIREAFLSDELAVDVTVLPPIMEYKTIPQESYEGVFDKKTPSFKNYRESLQGVFGEN